MQTALVTAALEVLVTAGIAAQDKVVHPRAGAPGQWRVLGQVNANLTADHDEIIVRGPYDNFRRIKFKVTDAPLNLHRLVVTYDNGAPDKDVRVKITEASAKEVARDAYFWMWPMVKICGQQLAHHWSTISNESAFGTDYFTRTAVAKSNILVNSPNEMKYFYQDLDISGNRLNSAKRYTVTFAKGATLPVHGFWSLSIYNEHHFFVANAIKRFSVGTENKDLKLAPDGSWTPPPVTPVQ